MVKNIKGKNTEIIVSALFFSGCFVFFYLFYDHHLYFVEQQQIFLLTPEYFFSFLSKPGFLSSYLGDFLTQFFYLRGGGAVVITLLLVLSWYLVKKLSEKLTGRKAWLLVPLIPFIAGWTAFCDIAFPAAVIVSFFISVGATLIYFSIPERRIRISAGFVLIPVLYLIAGSYFFLFVIFAVLFETLQAGSSRNLIIWSFSVIAVILPLCLKGAFLITTPQAYTWVSEAVPNPGLVHFLPFIALIFAGALSMVADMSFNFKFTPGVSIVIQSAAALVILLSGLWLRADFNLEKILNLDYEADHGRWGRVYDLSVRYGLRNNVSSYYTNIAMSKLGIMADELMDHYQPAATGLFIPVNANENYITITFSNEVYWQLGDINASQHSALLGMIFSPGSRNSRLMKRLVEINIVNGEYAVAGKYIGILEKTLFHRKWAVERRRFLYNEGECLRSQWITSKRQIIPADDLLKKGNEYKKSLEMLIQDHPGNKMAVDYLLCFDLLDKDLPSFRNDFRKYYMPEGKAVLPRVYQEALLIEIASGRNKPSDFGNFIFSPANVKRMADYTALYEKSNGDGRLLQKDFGNSYWFYYHFATMAGEKDKTGG